MPEFLALITPDEALKLMAERFQPRLEYETRPTVDALGRVTGEDIQSPQDLPDFRRSTVDGYAVRAADTYGASTSLPAYLNLAGEVLMGESSDLQLHQGDCILIHTGGMLPENADAVVMLEDTQPLESGEIEIYRSAAVGENIIEVGEDIRSGERVISAGTRIRPAEIGGLLALGITSLKTVCPPRFGIISSGDEVIPPEERPGPGQVRDINTYTLASLITTLGGESVPYGIIPDNRRSLGETLGQALNECDHVIVTAGSSASARDLTAEMMDEMGSPGLLVHGVSIKPGKPTIFALAGNQLMIGLPGNPVSALVIAQILVRPLIEACLGLSRPRPLPSVPATLTTNIPSQAGREDWIPVRLENPGSGNYQAEPIFGRSNLIFLLARADGLLKIPSQATGIEAGAKVIIRLI